METRSFIFTEGILKHKIEYAEADFEYIYGEIFEERGVPKDAIKYLVISEEHDGRLIPVIDSHAPEEYKRGAVAHEHFCRCCHDYDEPLGIRDDYHHCADAERLILDHFGGDKKEFIKQRKIMFYTVINYGLNGDPEVIARMKEALKLLNTQ